MLKKGLKARPHDLLKVLEMGPQMVEFHADAKDLDKELPADLKSDVQICVHVPEYDGDTLLDLSSNNDDVRRRSVAMLEKSLSTTRRWAEHFRGTPKAVVHPGAWSNEPLTRAQSRPLYDNFLASLKEVNQNGVDLLVENMPPHPWFYGGQWHCNIFMDPRDCLDFCSGNAVGLCLDVCHAFLWCNSVGAKVVDFCKKVLPVTAHVHFSDAKGTDGEGLQIGEGDLPLRDIFDAIGHVQVGWIPEVWQAHKDDFKEMRRVWPLMDALAGAKNGN